MTSWWAVSAAALAMGVVGHLTGRGSPRGVPDRGGPCRPPPGGELVARHHHRCLAAVATWAVGGVAGWAALPAYLLFAWLTVGLVWIDLDVHRLPVGLVVPTGAAIVALLAVASLADGGTRWVTALAGALAMGATYLLLAALPGGGVGGGDVRLAPLIGALLGWLGRGRGGPRDGDRLPRRRGGGCGAPPARTGGLEDVDRLRTGDVHRRLGRHRRDIPDPDLASGRLRHAWKDSPHAALADRRGVARAPLVATVDGLPAGVEVTTPTWRRPWPAAASATAAARGWRSSRTRSSSSGGSARAHPRLAGRDPHRQHRVAEVADRHGPDPVEPRPGGRGDVAERRSPATARSPGRGRGTPTSWACRSTASTTPGRCWSAPRPRDRRAGRPGRGGVAPAPPGVRHPARLAHGCHRRARRPRRPRPPDRRRRRGARRGPGARVRPGGSARRWSPRSTRPTRTATPSAASSRSSSPASRRVWAARALGPPARRAPRRRPHGHPGDQGGGGR